MLISRIIKSASAATYFTYTVRRNAAVLSGPTTGLTLSNAFNQMATAQAAEIAAESLTVNGVQIETITSKGLMTSRIINASGALAPYAVETVFNGVVASVAGGLSLANALAKVRDDQAAVLTSESATVFQAQIATSVSRPTP